MSQMDQTLHFDHTPVTSGLPRLADIFGIRRHVSKVPTAEVRRFTQSLRQREPAAMVAPYDESVWPSDAQLCCQFQDTINAGAF
jgi:hypothetical protein